jgi:putative endonuclease
MDTPYYFYLLKCSDDSIYAGISIDLEKRLNSHNSGKGAKYTRSRLPVEIVYSEQLENKSTALKREIEVKKWSRVKKLKLIENANS